MIQLLNADCIPFLASARLDQKCFVYTDPAYSHHVHKNAVSQSSNRGTRKRDLGFDCVRNIDRAALCYFVGRNARWAVIYSDIEGASLWQDGLRDAARYIRTIPWVRWSMAQLCGWNIPQGSESIVIGHGSGAVERQGKEIGAWDGPGNLCNFDEEPDTEFLLDYVDEKCLRGEDKHKAEKPLDQALKIVEYGSLPGELVVDSFAGNGTIGRACQILNRHYLGYEINPETHAKASRRLESSLSDGEKERVERWQKAREKDAGERERMRVINEASKAKARAKKAAKAAQSG